MFDFLNFILTDIKKVRAISPFSAELKQKEFNVFQIEGDGAATRIYSRKDIYEICLPSGKSIIPEVAGTLRKSSAIPMV